MGMFLRKMTASNRNRRDLPNPETKESRMNKKKKNPADSVRRLYETSLPSTRTGPLYNAFSYPTKISPEAIAVFIATPTTLDSSRS